MLLVVTHHASTEVVGYKVFPRDFTVLALVERDQTEHSHASQYHEEQPIARIIRVTDRP